MAIEPKRIEIETTITAAREASRQNARIRIVSTLKRVKRRHNSRGRMKGPAGVWYETACCAARTGEDDNVADYMRKHRISQSTFGLENGPLFRRVLRSQSSTCLKIP